MWSILSESFYYSGGKWKHFDLNFVATRYNYNYNYTILKLKPKLLKNDFLPQVVISWSRWRSKRHFYFLLETNFIEQDFFLMISFIIFEKSIFFLIHCLDVKKS